MREKEGLHRPNSRFSSLARALLINFSALLTANFITAVYQTPVKLKFGKLSARFRSLLGRVAAFCICRWKWSSSRALD